MTMTRVRRAAAFAGAAVVLSAMLTGCGALGSLLGNDVQRDDEGNVTEEGSIDIFSLSVGDCMPYTDDIGEMSEASVVPCSEPHADEVFYEFEAPDGEIPTEEEFQAAVEEQCLPAFKDYVGIDYQDSTLGIWWITPTQETWDQANDRLVQCVVFDEADQELTGSLKGAAR